MKIRLSLLSLLLGLAVAPAVIAQDGPKGPAAGQEKEPDTELGKKMEKLNGAYRKLRRQVADPAQNQDSLAQVAIIRDQTNAAMKLEPAKKADIPAAEQAKFVADYQAKMKEFIVELDKLEAALKAGNNVDAKASFDAMGKMQKADHSEFKKKDKKS